MMSSLISSLQHPLVKRMVKLRTSRSFRNQEQLVLITGERVVKEVSLCTPLKTLITTTPLLFSAKQRVIASPAVIRKIIGLPTATDLVAAEVSLPAPSSLKGKGKIIILDGLADPGNLGTLLRTALGLGWEGAFLTHQTVDPFNDKAIRASRGAPLFLPLRQGNWEELETVIKMNQMKVYIADVNGKSARKIVYKEPFALVLGHETRGPSSVAKNSGLSISIPMSYPVESLNVASAGAILMYQMSHPKP